MSVASREHLIGRFRDEAGDRLDAIVDGLLTLERGAGSPETIDALFRHAHSIKGAAGMIGLDHACSLAHGIEDVLAGARERGELGRAEIASLLGEADRLREAVGAEGVPASPAPSGAGSLRVSAEKVDRVLDAVGEAVLHHRHVDHLVRSPVAQASAEQVEDEFDRGELLLGELQQSVMELRMLPLESITGPFPRAVRDLAVEQGKDVELVIEGAETQLDRTVLDTLSDPLIHLLRNAVAHGIEPPDERERAGKPARGRIELRAAQRGELVVLQVADDGRGVAAGLLERAAQRPLVEVLAEAGLSTARTVTEIAGRGVGLDAVRRGVEDIGGSIEMRSTQGAGTTVTLVLPVSLALVHALVVERTGSVLAFALADVETVVSVTEVMSLSGHRSLTVRGATVPAADLVAALGGPSEQLPARMAAVVVTSDAGRAALLCDRVLGEQELVAKGLGPLLGGVPGYQGCAVLGDGRVALLVDSGFVARAAARRTEASAPREPLVEPTVLVVDDQFTVRELQRSILEAAGYRVLTARDGREALDRLAEDDVEVVVTDIEMPVIDGFGLLARIRADPALGSLPVVLVSSGGSADDERRGLEAGADAYIGKARFDQTALLETVARLGGR